MNPCTRFARLRDPLWLAALSLAGAATAQTRVVVPCDLDNTLYESTTGSVSNALGESLFVGVTAQGRFRRALLRFDVAAAVPTGSRILAATLAIQVITSGAAQPAAVSGHRVTRAWGEGTSYAVSGGGGQGAPSTNGDATWIHAFFPGTLWTNPGGDFAPAPSFTLSMPTLGPVRAGATQAAAADVQLWLDQPQQNHGWLLKADVETLAAARARRLDSRESLTPRARPSLLVTYLTPGQDGTWGVGCPVGAGRMRTDFVGSPVGGTTIRIVHADAPANRVGATFFALDLDPAGALLAPACRIHLPLAGPILPGDLFVTGNAGDASTPFAVPAGFPGFLVACQAAVGDSSALGFALGNAAVVVLL